MATGKKSFILYCDLIHEVDHLTDEEKGKLFQHLLEYVNDMNPVLEDRVLLGSWKHIQRQLKRDLIKYEDIKEKRSEAGKASAEKRKQTATNPTSVEPVEQTPTNPTVNDNGTDTVNGTDIVTVIKKEKATHSFFESEELNDVFSKWLYACANEVKMSVRKAHGQSAIEALAMKLNRMPVDKAIRQVRQSLENGWVTLRPIEDLPNGRESETEADRAAREFMETVKAYNTHKTLYGEESANEKFNMNNGNVQSSIDNKRIA